MIEGRGRPPRSQKICINPTDTYRSLVSIHIDLFSFVTLLNLKIQVLHLSVDSNPYNRTPFDHVLCLHAFPLRIQAILAFRETVHPRDHLTDGPQLPTTRHLRAHAPIPMISTATRVERGNLPANLRANLRAVPKLFGTDKEEEAFSYREEEDF